MASNVKAEIKGKNLVITLPMQSPTPSSSGKTMVIATTRGNVKTDLEVKGKPVTIGVNAYFYKD
jgi:hypothetical protein